MTRIKLPPQIDYMYSEKGQILPLIIIVVAVVLFSTLFIIGGAQVYFSNSTYTVGAETATALAEAGLDKAVESLNKSGGSYSGETETPLGNGSYSVEVISKDAATKIIQATGYIPNKTAPRVKRTVQIEATRGVGVSFNYGVQVGEGGLELGNNNTVNGSIYSNGNISAGNNNTITGDAWVAGGTQFFADQSTDCQGVNCADFLFGKNINGENRLDVAQSFQPQTSTVINKVALKLRKIGTPPDVTVRILGDSGGSPNKNNILTTGTLVSSLVTSNYGWIDVTFATTPNLNANTTYWIMIDTSANSSNYWSWQNDLALSYNRGSPKWSANWNAATPIWTAFSGDLSFQVYMGGTITSISGGLDNRVNGSVHANTISSITIGTDAFYKTITNSTVFGSACPNSHCFPGSADPPPKVFPISEANIAEWKDQADVNTTSSISNCVANLGPTRVVGNISLGNNCTIIVQSPIWVTGNITLGNDNTFRLNSSYGTTSGLIVIDGKIIMGNNNSFAGSGQGSSLLMVLTTFDSRVNNEDAVTIGNNGNTGVFYADKGIINPGNNNQFRELTAWKIRLANNAQINYETGLSSTLFSSGPSGTFSLVKGTYQTK